MCDLGIMKELIAICIVFITHTSCYNCIWIKAGLLYMLVFKTWDHHASGYESLYLSRDM